MVTYPAALDLPHALVELVTVGTAYAYTRAVTGLLADHAPTLAEALREAAPDYVLLDGAVAECDQLGDGTADYSGKKKRHGVNIQAITGEDGTILWFSPALPGRTHDLTAAREHEVVSTCEELGIAVLADKGYIGAGGSVETPFKAAMGCELTEKLRRFNKVHARLRAPVERAFARLKSWRIFRHARCSPNWLSSVTAAILTLTVHT